MKLNKVFKIYIEDIIDRGNVIVVENPLTIKFHVKRNMFASANTADFSIYNLAGQRRDRIYQDIYALTDDERRGIIFDVGYSDSQLSTAFAGTVLKAYSTREGSNIVTKIHALDGAVNTKTSFLNKTFIGQTLTNLLTGIACAINGLTIGAINSPSTMFERPVVLSGPAWEYMQEYSGKTAYIDNQKIYVIQENDAIEGYVPILTDDTGLLGVPERQGSTISVNCMFEPRIIVGQIIQLNSRLAPLFDGQYKVIGVEHSGTISDTSQSQATTRLDLWVGSEKLGEFNVITPQ